MAPPEKLAVIDRLALETTVLSLNALITASQLQDAKLIDSARDTYAVQTHEWRRWYA